MPGTRTRGSRVTFWIGLGILLAGLALLGYVGWQFWGTNWKSRPTRSRSPTPSRPSGAGQGRREALAPKYVPKGQALGADPDPLVRKSYVVPVLEGISTDVLAKGFGHFPKSADPGEVGNYALAAHRVTGQPLHRMPELRPGDDVSSRPSPRPTPTSSTRTRTSWWCPSPAPGCSTRCRRTRRRVARSPRSERPAADHPDHLRGAVPHRQPDDRLRPPGQDRPEALGRRVGNLRAMSADP